MRRVKSWLTTRADRHHIRASFYHVGIYVFLLMSILHYFNVVDATFYKFFSASLIVVDYFAEMYDPNPDAMGSWFKRHFHRMIEETDDD